MHWGKEGLWGGCNTLGPQGRAQEAYPKAQIGRRRFKGAEIKAHKARGRREGPVGNKRRLGRVNLGGGDAGGGSWWSGPGGGGGGGGGGYDCDDDLDYAGSDADLVNGASQPPRQPGPGSLGPGPGSRSADGGPTASSLPHADPTAGPSGLPLGARGGGGQAADHQVRGPLLLETQNPEP